METSDWISIGSLAIAVGAFLYSYFTNTKKYELSSQYRTEILTWYADTIDILIRLKTEAKSNFPNPELRRELLSRLSASVETGRFYFPNVEKGDGFGADKPTAYRGYRSLILDFLVFSFRLFERDDAKIYLKHAEELERHFTSLVFEVIDPNTYLKETKQHTAKNFTKGLRYEDFLQKGPETLKAFLRSGN
jgi:hypothetical protein